MIALLMAYFSVLPQLEGGFVSLSRGVPDRGTAVRPRGVRATVELVESRGEVTAVRLFWNEEMWELKVAFLDFVDEEFPVGDRVARYRLVATGPEWEPGESVWVDVKVNGVWRHAGSPKIVEAIRSD